MKLAVEHVRRMRGGAQAHLMRCEDGGYYIVKFQNNPQHLKILANEMLATRLAARLGLCVPQVEVIEVRPELIAYTSELVVQLGIGRMPCSPGKQFGSQFPGHPARMTVHDFLPDEQLGGVRNLPDFLGILVFDKWTCNTNGRQAIFFREPEDLAGQAPGAGPAPYAAPSAPPYADSYIAMMIDHGFCFNAGEWDFPDAPLRGLYARHRVYQGVAGMQAFEPWLDRLEKHMTESALGEEAGHIPPEWYGDDWQALEDLIERLYARRKRVRELILSARNSGRDRFQTGRCEMPDEALQPCAYHVVRYQPNLIRDEWVNIGVLLLDPSSGRVRQRWLEESADFARLRRLHPAADEELLLRLPVEFDRQFSGAGSEASALIEKFDQTLSNAVQLSPRKGLLASDLDAELERLFREQVEPLRETRRGAGEIRTRSDVRAQAADYFRSEKILRLMERGVPAAEFTVPGDPMRIDFSYRRNGTRGFVHAVALGRDPGQAKLLAFTAEAIRGRLEHSEFLAVTEREPARGNVRDQFVSSVLADNGIRLVPLAGLRKWAHDVAPVQSRVTGLP